MVTLADVAREAEVSVSTASRALSNPDRVKQSTRDHVRSVARRLGYQHTRITVESSQMLALLVNDVTNPYHFGLIRGAEAQARAAGYTLVFAEAQENRQNEQTHVDRLGAFVEGFILVASRQSDAALAEIARHRKVVVMNRDIPDVSSVLTDTTDSCGQIIDHLVALGHRRLAYLSSPASPWSDSLRWSALSARASESAVDLIRLGPFLPTFEQGAAAAEVAVASGATAIVAFNDVLAIGVLHRLHRRGIPVPERISVVGYDDIFGADFCNPPLTTVSTPVEEIGRIAVDLLLDVISGRPASRVTLPTYLRVRDSTGPVAA